MTVDVVVDTVVIPLTVLTAVEVEVEVVVIYARYGR